MILAIQLFVQDKKVKGKIDARNKLETYVYNIKSSIEDKLKDKISEDDAETVKKAVSDTLEWCDKRLVWSDFWSCAAAFAAVTTGGSCTPFRPCRVSGCALLRCCASCYHCTVLIWKDECFAGWTRTATQSRMITRRSSRSWRMLPTQSSARCALASPVKCCWAPNLPAKLRAGCCIEGTQALSPCLRTKSRRQFI